MFGGGGGGEECGSVLRILWRFRRLLIEELGLLGLRIHGLRLSIKTWGLGFRIFGCEEAHLILKWRLHCKRIAGIGFLFLLRLLLGIF